MRGEGNGQSATCLTSDIMHGRSEKGERHVYYFLVPNCPNMSATSSRFTTPSLSLSRIWNASLSVRTCAGNSCDSALPLADCDLVGAGLDGDRCAGDPRSGDGGPI